MKKINFFAKFNALYPSDTTNWNYVDDLCAVEHIGFFFSFSSYSVTGLIEELVS
jgi:hypothetical protein